MTLSVDTVVNYYTGDGSQTEFDYTFKIFSNSDLVVTTVDDDDVETTLSLDDGDYEVTGAGLDDGGTITLADALTSGYTMSIKRVRPLTQETDLRNNAEYYPVSHEDALDHIVMIAQQQQEEIERTIRLSRFDDNDGFDTELPPGALDNVGRSIIINDSGTGLEWGPTGDVLAAAAQNAADAMQAASEAAISAGSAESYAAAAELSAGEASSYAAACLALYQGSLFSVTGVKTANYSAVSATMEVIRCDPSAAGFTVSLPPANANLNVRKIIKNVADSSNAIRVAVAGYAPYGIDGAEYVDLEEAYGVVEVIGTGLGWLVLR